jgi:hypothetical protein
MTNPLLNKFSAAALSEAAFLDYTYSCLFACKQLVAWNYYDYCARSLPVKMIFIVSLSGAQQLCIIRHAKRLPQESRGCKNSRQPLMRLYQMWMDFCWCVLITFAENWKLLTKICFIQFFIIIFYTI